MAKSLAAGLPLSAVVGKAEIMDAPAPGGLGGTYAGNPLACAAGLAVLDVFEDERLLDRAERLGSRIGTHLRALQQRVPQIGDVRGLVPLTVAADDLDRGFAILGDAFTSVGETRP